MERRRLILGFIMIAIFFIPFTVTNQTNTRIINPDEKTISTQTRSDQWILDLQSNYNNPNWYFNHLNVNDRLLIRQALDYAMPRTVIINSILNGFGHLLATYEVPQVGVFYDSSVQPLPYSLTNSLTLLAQVFGYKFSAVSNNLTTPYDETQPYFPINLLVPNSNPTRIQHANLITGIFKAIGIGATLVEASFANVLDRAFPSSSAMLGLDYNHGGFDGVFIGWGGGTLPDDGAQWFGSSYIPNNNYQNVNDSFIDHLIDQENNQSLTLQERINAFHQMQQYVASQSLKYILLQNIAPYIYSKDFQGFNQFFATSGTIPYQNITIGTSTSMTIGLSAIYSDLMPLIANDLYSSYIYSNLWLGGLLRFSTIPGNSGQQTYDIYPNLAYNNYTISSDGMFYNFTIKPHIYWADGSELTAQDVKFTYQSIMTPNRSAIAYGTFANYMKNTSIIVYDRYHLGFQLTKWADPFPFGLNLFTQTIIPELTYESISDWKNCMQNTGNGVNASNYNSNGPYQISAINPSTGFANLTVNPLFNQTIFIFSDDDGPTVESYAEYVSHVPGFNVTPTMKNVLFKIETDPNLALTDLTNNVIQYVDTNVGLTQVFSMIYQNTQQGIIANFNATGSVFQELGLNQASPIWGYSPIGILNTDPITTTTSTVISSTIPSSTVISSTIPSSTIVSSTVPPSTTPSSTLPSSTTPSQTSNTINTSDWGIFGSESIFAFVGIMSPFIAYYFRKKSIKK